MSDLINGLVVVEPPTRLESYEAILIAATNPASYPRPKEIHVNREFAIHLFGKQAVDFTNKHKYNDIMVMVLSMPVSFSLLYGDYDPANFM